MSLFPWKKRRAITSQVVDRYRMEQHNRIACGIFVDEQFRDVSGCLLSFRGSGRWLRPELVAFERAAIPDSLSEMLVELRNERAPPIDEFSSSLDDLAEIQATVIARLCREVDGGANRVLVAGIRDPGWWHREPGGGPPAYWPLCASDAIAERTGISVIDSFPSRDIAAGGVGEPLEPLAKWLMFSERNERVSTHPRVLIELDDQSVLTRLPESDGLDAEYPDIRICRASGRQWIQSIMHQFGIGSLSNNRIFEAATGCNVIPELYEHFAKAVEANAFEFDMPDSPLVDDCAQRGFSAAEIVRTACEVVAEQICSAAAGFTGGNAAAQWIVAGKHAEIGLIMSLIKLQNDGVQVRRIEEFTMTRDSLDPAVAAVMAMMHVDQFAVSLPGLTGCAHPRVLGRLTPGRPSNWRRLVIEMADYHPPAMKLRDAI